MIAARVSAPIVLDPGNPGPMTGTGNHTYLIVSKGAAGLVDAGVGQPDHLRALDRALVAHDASLQMVLVTHNHSDHIDGVGAIAAAHPQSRFARCVGAEEAARGVVWVGLAEGEHVHIGDASVRVVSTPGHSPDHLAFWDETAGIMYTGDLVVAGSSVMIDVAHGGNLVQYLSSLRRVLDFGPRQLFPAHGPVIDDPAAVVHSYLEHRQMREDQIVAAIRAGDRTVEAIAESIYDGLEAPLMSAARENVRAHLEKLAADAVAADRDGWRIL
jgi:glyoxylase-like metal-dependent hydrolase (beta-lactamase superfamily II)